MLKIAIDTNIIFSAIVYRGKPRQLLGLAEKNQIRLGIPKYCVLEIESVFKDKLGTNWETYFRNLTDWADVYSELLPKPRNKVVSQYKDCTRDVFDTPVIASVVAWQPDYFVGTDKGYFNEEVEKYVRIASVSEILALFHAKDGQAKG